MTPNMRAFLDMLAWSEIGPTLLAETDNGYNVVVGSTAQHPITFSDYSHHPRLYCKAMNSDAAGRYQFLGRYWATYKMQLGLPDFGHDSQDKWAIQLIGECHARDDVDTGHVSVAIPKCASRWASLPGNSYGQPQHSADGLIAAYVAAGGVIA